MAEAWRSPGVCQPAKIARSKQAGIPIGSLADLDCRLLPGSRTRYFPLVCPWPGPLDGCLAGLGDLDHGHRGAFGKLPGVEPRPYIIRFTEDKPNPLYRRICYTVAWSELLAYALLNLTGLLIACWTGKWRMAQIYDAAYFPDGRCWSGFWAYWASYRALRSPPKGEGVERRYFYGTVWAVPCAQAVLWLLMASAAHQRGDELDKAGRVS